MNVSTLYSKIILMSKLSYVTHTHPQLSVAEPEVLIMHLNWVSRSKSDHLKVSKSQKQLDKN